MSCSKFVVTVLACALMFAVPAAAVQNFWDDFQDNDMSDWTDIQKQVRPFSQVIHGVYGYASRGEDPLEAKEAVAEKALDNTTLSDTLYISFEVMHTGGYKGQGGNGWKSTRMAMVDDSGAGYAIYIGISKSGTVASMNLQETTDNGASWTDVGGTDTPLVPPNDYAEHKVEVVWDTVMATMDVSFDGSLYSQWALDLTQNDLYKNFTKVLSGPRNTYGGWPGYLTTDDMWIGDQANPNGPDPILVQGDSDGNLKVDIVDLTAVAANWSTLSPGTKDWTEGDFNYDWLVDIVDLTALAANWSFAGSPPPVPEPASMALFGLAGLALLRKRR